MTTTIQPAEGTPLVYQCALPLSRQTLTYIVGLLRAHLKKIGSRGPKTIARSAECSPSAPTTRSKRRRRPPAKATSTPSASWVSPAI